MESELAVDRVLLAKKKGNPVPSSHHLLWWGMGRRGRGQRAMWRQVCSVGRGGGRFKLLLVPPAKP